MSVTIYGVEELMASIKQDGDRAEKGVFKEMMKAGGEIQQLAREFAPVDKGDLEKAIKVRAEGGERSSLGRFTKKSIEVFVDESVPSSDGSGKSVADYAWEMHEHLTPYGGLQLGPKSREKQMGSNGTVGGGYLERAVDEISEDLMERLNQKSRDVF